KPPNDLGSLKTGQDEPRWPDLIPATAAPVAPPPLVDRGPSEHTLVIWGRRTRLSPDKPVTALPSEKDAALSSSKNPSVPPEVPERKRTDPRLVLLLVLNVTFLLVAALILYFAVKK